jgi:enoyl-[acyl-carrier protein] reductase I
MNSGHSSSTSNPSATAHTSEAIFGNLLKGKKGVVMGVANDKSIAWACAEAARAAGATLAFNFLGPAQEKRVRALVAPGDIVAPCDVTKDDEVQNFFATVAKEWDGIDFVIHSVAFTDKECLKEPFVKTGRAQFASTLDISAYSLVAISREAAPLMRNGGSIVAMSYYGAEKVVPKYNVMGVAKAALESCSKYLAEDLGPQGIRVNCVSAGPIRTLSSSAIPGIKSMLESAEKFAPLRRNITGEDIGRSTLYLLSDLSSGVTGEILHVDCGYNILGMFQANVE